MVDFVHKGLFKSRSRAVQDSTLSVLERKPYTPGTKLFVCPSSELKAYHWTYHLTVAVVKLAETDVEILPKPPARNDGSKIV